MSRKKGPPYSSLSHRLEEIKDDKKRILSAVMLTYEFDSDLLKLLVETSLLDLNGSEDVECLRMEGQLPAVIFYHPKREQKGSLPSNVELHFWKGEQAFSCHHSKVYAFIFDDMSAELIIGSMNFTKSGLFSNREIFWDFNVSKHCRQDVPIFVQWLDFVKKQLIARAPESPILNSYLDNLTEIIHSEGLKEDICVGAPCLINSGYNRDCNGLQRLSQYTNEQLIPVKLVVVSPFFDKAESTKQVIDNFISEFPKISQVTVFSNNWPNTFSREYNKLKVQRYYVPQKIEQREIDLLIEYYGSELQIDDKMRELHGKLLMLLDEDGNGVIYAGSANFSSNAWCGKNYELGVASYVSMGINSERKILNFVQNLLGVKCINISSSKLQNLEVKDPEEQDLKYFLPPGLESVQLVGINSEAGELQGEFILKMLKNVSIEGAYSWEGIDLIFHQSDNQNQWRSQRIDLKTINERIGMNRWITWSIDGGISTVAIPFNVDSSFRVPSEFGFNVNNENLLEYLTELIYFGNKRESSNFNCSKESSKGNWQIEDASFVDRDKNTVVYIQNWLRSLSELELALFVEDEKLNASVPIADLPIYFGCMVRHMAHLTKISDDGRCFCVGEIFLLAKRVYKVAAKQFSIASRSPNFNYLWSDVFCEIESVFKSCVEKAELNTDSQVLKIYKQFVLRGNDETTR
ncbi:hypothetical protein QUV44_07525 [Parasutterella secunda]|uniref:hypothetical protein n=1 Tax=Parasutterella secunda TaxID=626947 RepID=UPI0025A4247E|nr:hypothetical protein [Parasutterella secunda]MDM8088041.1 hypothetical protein [Parasutterella secunda]